MAGMQPSVWICVLFTLIGRSQLDSVTACFGPNPPYNSFNITCDEHTKIRITGAEYRYSNSSNSSGISNQPCQLNNNDCKGNYSYQHAVILYKRCSGLKSCLNNLVPTPTNHVCENYTGDKYAHVTYECIDDTKFIDMCQADVKETSEVNIMFYSGNTTSNPITCSCYVEKATMVTYQLVDVRLFTNVSETEGTYDCVDSTFQASNKLFQCNISNDKSFIYLNSADFDGDIGDIKQSPKIVELSNTGRKGRPDMVWVHLKEQSNGNERFGIECKTVPSASTTEIISTPKGKTSTVIASLSPVEVTNSFSTTKAASYSTSTFLQAMTTNASDEPPVAGKQQENIGVNSLPIIVGVVVAAIIVIAIVSAALIILKRRHRKSKEDECPKSEPPNCLSNRNYEYLDDTGKGNAVVETSNYDSITDDSVPTYIPPVKKTKDDSSINEDKTKYIGNISCNEYDMIEFDNKRAKKVPNYAFLPGKIRDDTYSHVSNQAEFVHSSANTDSGYYHCTLNKKETQNNVDDYSRVDLEGDWKTQNQPNTNEEGPYNHIASDNAESMLNGKHDIKLDKSPTIFMDRNYGVPLNIPNQDIMSASLGGNSINLKQDDLYVKPKFKYQQYTAVIKVQSGKEYDGTDNSNIETLRLDGNDNIAQDTRNNYDYELAKPI